MPDGDVALHGRQRLLVENLADQAEILEHQHLRPVCHGDAGGLLAAVLQGVQPVVGEFGDFFAGGPYAEYTAFFAGRILVGHWLLGGHGAAAPWGADGDVTQSTETAAKCTESDQRVDLFIWPVARHFRLRALAQQSQLSLVLASERI